jgi:hypothetical protein
MATTTSITTTYAGELDAQKYISAALLSAPTLDKGLITIKPNVKHKMVVKNLITGDLLADATCDFTDTSSVTLTERILEPKELQVNLMLCKQDFRDDWDAISMGYSAFDNLPPSFEAYLASYVAEKVAAQNEVAIWRGATGTGGSFDGFATLIALDADLPAAKEIAGTTVTASNVVAQLQLIVAQIPATIYGDPDTCIYVSQHIYRAYIQALGTLGYVDRYNNQTFGEGLVIDGVPLKMVQGLNDNTAIATRKSNLWFGTGLMSDRNMVKVIDTSETLGDENVRVVMRMTAGVQYGNISEIVTYGIANGAN